MMSFVSKMTSITAFSLNFSTHFLLRKLNIICVSVFQEIIWRLLLIIIVNTALIVLPMYFGIAVPAISAVPHTLIGLPLGLLLVFRTETAYVCSLPAHLDVCCRSHSVLIVSLSVY